MNNGAMLTLRLTAADSEMLRRAVIACGDPDRSHFVRRAIGLSMRARMQEQADHIHQLAAAEERAKAAEWRAKAAEERAKAAEERAKAAEERAKAAEERAKAAEERAKAAEERVARAEAAVAAEARARGWKT